MASGSDVECAAKRRGPADSADVVVIGAGPVGQSAALLLARWGIRSIVVDAAPARTPVGSKAICQQRDVLDIWESVGAGRRIAGKGLTWTTARTFYQEQELSAWSFAEQDTSPFPPFVNVSQATTERILDEAIAEQPSIEVNWAHNVVGIDQDDHEVRVRCQTPAGPRVLTAAFALVCGGARGDDLRAMLGLDFPGETFNDRFLICDIKVDLPGWEAERRYYFDPPWNPDRQVLIHPCPDSVYRIDWQVEPDFDLEREERSGRLHERITKIVGSAPYDVVWQSVYRFHARAVRRMRLGRVLVAGDCAHLVPPFGARGLNSGVQDAENAAWKLAFVLRGWADETLLDSYHPERHAAALENLAVTRATMRFTVPQSEAEWRHRRRQLETAREDPTLAAQIDSGRFAEPYWYLDSPLTTPHPTRTFRGRPPKGERPPAVPGVLVPDAPLAGAQLAGPTLRSLTRNGFLVLTTPGADSATLAAAVSRHARAPGTVLALADIDQSGSVATALSATDDQSWVIRPDGHIAAIIDTPTPETVLAAIERAGSRLRS